MPKSWRDVLPIHPACALFPPMSADELRELGEDIIKNGMTSSIALWRADPDAQLQLLDGRNRLDGIELVTGDPVTLALELLFPGSLTERWVIRAGERKWGGVIELEAPTDPYTYVISANIVRRHLTAEKKRELIAEQSQQHPSLLDHFVGA
jgi:hypothetical protein